MKKYIVPVAAFIAGMAIVPSVFADGATSVHNWDDLKTCLRSTTKESRECVLAEDIDDATFDLVKISDGDEDIDVVLNLGGHTCISRPMRRGGR